ncbi:MAG: hypothetical protein ACO32I_09300 [Candidatus Limnocylindrus sp.]|jgi:hypothetical protein
MSHNTITLNGTEPTATGAVNSTIAWAVENSRVTSVNYGTSGLAAVAGVARSWRRGSAAGGYTQQILSAGFSLGNSPRRLSALSTSEYYETVTVPSGTWLATFKVGSNNLELASSTTRAAIYRNDTGAIVSNIISFRDVNRCPVCVAILQGGITYELRVIAGALTSIATNLAAGTAGWSFRKVA